MAFWGVEVKPGKPFTHKATDAAGTKRLHLSQATLGLGNATARSILQCNVGNKRPLFLCGLSPEKVDSCQLNLEFEESDEVIFSVIGPRSVHLTGYFLGRSRQNDDESESYGQDIAGTDMENGSSDDYDYSDSFINDDDPSACGSHLSSTDDDEISIKEMASRKKDKKKNGKKGRRLMKKFQVCVSDSDETSGKADDPTNGDSSEAPLPSRVTRSKAKSSGRENGEPNAKCEKKSEAKTHTLKTLDEGKETPLGDVEPSSVQKSSEILSEKKQSKESVVIHLDDEEGKHMPQNLQNEKPATDKGIESSQSGDATRSKKKRKRDKREGTTDVQENLVECSEKKKQAINKKIKKEAGTKRPIESEIAPNEVTTEEIEKGNLAGKVAVEGKKVSILYSAKLRDTGKLFLSNLGEAPLKFRIGGDKVIKGLSIGVEGMRVGEKRRIVIPPSLGYSEEGFKDVVPKNAWLVYEVKVVKVR